MDTQTKQEILDATRATRSPYEALFDRIPTDQLTKPGAAGEWSAKDLQAHINSSHRWMIGQLRALVRGTVPTASDCYEHTTPPPAGSNLGDQDERNAWHHSVYQHWSVADVLSRAKPTADDLEAAIAAVPVEEFARPYTYGENGYVAQIRPAHGGELTQTLGAMIASYANKHYASHSADLQTAWEHGLYSA